MIIEVVLIGSSYVDFAEQIPMYNLPAVSLVHVSSSFIFEKKLSDANIPGLGNVLISFLKIVPTWEDASFIVALDAIYFGLLSSFLDKISTAISYTPTILPRGPSIRCNSS